MSMTNDQFIELIRNGESSKVEFKSESVRPESLTILSIMKRERTRKKRFDTSIHNIIGLP